jgi:hypothetical protein
MFAIRVEGSGVGGQAKLRRGRFGRGSGLCHPQHTDYAGGGNAGRHNLPAG